jgi:hypothetical protein
VLNVTAKSLQRLAVGWDGETWTMPMQDGRGHLIGIQRRTVPRKCCVEGSHLGLFVPQRLDGNGMLLVAEGATDVATLLDMGFSAIGRPNCNTGGAMVRVWCQAHPYTRVVVVADNDEPGRRGAEILAQQLHARTARPPPEYKDVRSWTRDRKLWEARLA